MIFEQVPEFQKELKKLSKKWRSLPGDIAAAERGITPLYVKQTDVDINRLREAFFNGRTATILSRSETREVVKMRLDVASLGRNDKVRIVFIAIVSENTVKFIELFAKNDKPREDTTRIKKYLIA